MCGRDDRALALLPVDHVEARHCDLLRRDQVVQHVARADGRQLVSVAYEQQVRPCRHGLQERGGKAGVEHRGFVDDEKIRRERAVLV